MSEHLPIKTGWFTRLTHHVHNIYVWSVTVVLVYGWFAAGAGDQEGADLSTYKLKILTWAVGALPVVLLITLLYVAISYSRKARYAEIMEHLHAVHHGMRDLFSEMKRFQHEHEIPADPNLVPAFVGLMKDKFRSLFLHRMQEALSMFADSFAITSGVKCRASIKMMGGVETKGIRPLDELYVKTLVRDLNSARECQEKDRNEKEDNLVSDNTDYQVIVKNKRNFYHSPNINAEDNYDNSSLEYWERNNPIRSSIKKKIPIVTKLLGFVRAEWGSLYPYVAVMVFPVRGKDQDGKPGIPIAFLAVDSKARNCFWERYDAYFGASVADAFFHVLEEYVLFMKKLQELNEETSAHAQLA